MTPPYGRCSENNGTILSYIANLRYWYFRKRAYLSPGAHRLWQEILGGMGMKRIVALVLVFLLPVTAGAVEINGKSAVLMDVATGTVLFEENPRRICQNEPILGFKPKRID